nr:transporter substrate-binding domain-containing protein [uncultured Pseudodesulfovibrio sp.]
MTHNLQKQAYIDRDTGQLRGVKHAGKRSFNIEIVHKLKQMMGNTTRIKSVPFARGMDTLNTHKAVAMFNVNKTLERAPLYKWVGPLQPEINFLYGLQRNSMIQTLDDARRVKSICVVNENSHHTRLYQLGFTNVITNNSYENCFQMLKDGRVDLTPLSESALDAMLAKTHIKHSNIHKVPEVLLQSQGYIAFSPDISDAEINQWQKAFDAIITSGTYTILYETYFTQN